MTRAGADIIVAHMGVTTGGAIGATSAKSLDDCVAEIDAIAAAARAERADVIVLCHGGPIADARRRRLRPRARPRLPRLLRRLLHGAPAGRARRSPNRPAPSRPSAKAEETAMPGKFVIRADVAPEILDWGQLRWLSNPPSTGAGQLTVIDVTLAPGKGHDFHKHPDQEEVIARSSPAQVEQWVDREKRILGPGDSAFVPAGVVHASFNAGSGEAQHRRDPRPLRRRGRLRLGRGGRRSPLEHAPLRGRAMPNNYPKLHNAMWPGIVGKGAPDSEPIIPLDTLLELTANAEADGQKFDGVDLFVVAPHFDIDSDLDAVKRMTDHIAGYGLAVGSFVAPIWAGAGGGSAMGSAGGAQAVPRPRSARPARSAARCASSASARPAASASTRSDLGRGLGQGPEGQLRS